jgi:hypothetical protein
MTHEEKIAILDERFIEHRINSDSILECLCHMTTFAGDDCSEWFPADEVIEWDDYTINR